MSDDLSFPLECAHPNLPGARTTARTPSSWRVLRGLGWEPAPKFDPSVHTVDEVNEYLSTADEAERARVLAVEADGKARSSIKAP